METRKRRQIVEAFIDGIKRFRRRNYSDPRTSALSTLAREGQKPHTLIVACIDSRLIPNEILDTMAGEVLTHRSVANIIPKCPSSPQDSPSETASALEFAVKSQNVQHIVVMGHSNCGGVEALMNISALQENSFIRSWVGQADSAKQAALSNNKSTHTKDLAKAAEEQALRFSLKNLMTYDFIRERVENGTLELHAWRYDIETGIMYSFNQSSNQFEELTAEHHEPELPRSKL